MDNDFAPGDKPGVFGLTAYIEGIDWPVSISFGIQSGDDDGTFFDSELGMMVDVQTEFLEYYAGMAKIWDKYEKLRPYVGGGLTVMDVEIRDTTTADSVVREDRTMAPYVNGGAFWVFKESFVVGIDARIVVAAGINIGGTQENADYKQASGFFGWLW